MDTRKVKRLFIEAYKKTYGNVKQTCEAVGIARNTFYMWREKDADFANEIQNLDPAEDFLDFLESKIAEKINEGDTAMIIFTAKTKGRKRGYDEKTSMDHTGEIKITVEEKVMS